jgi:hypothetical protein
MKNQPLPYRSDDNIVDLPPSDWRYVEPPEPPRPTFMQQAETLLMFVVSFAFMIFAAYGLKMLLYPPKPPAMQLSPAAARMEVGETRVLDGGWKVTREK